MAYSLRHVIPWTVIFLACLYLFACMVVLPPTFHTSLPPFSLFPLLPHTLNFFLPSSIDSWEGKVIELGRGKNGLFRKWHVFPLGTLSPSSYALPFQILMLGTPLWLESISPAYTVMWHTGKGSGQCCHHSTGMGVGIALVQGSGFLTGQRGGRHWTPPTSSHINCVFLLSW